VTGPTLADYATVKYDTNGVRLWSATYDGPAHDTDSAWAVATDGLGNTYVTGSSDGVGSGRDCTTVKYDVSGTQQWVARWAGAGEVGDGARAVAVDQSGNVYVAGQSDTNVLTIKYDAGGLMLWSSQYTGGGTARDVKVDSSGNVYVAGSYVTIKYGSDGTQVWASPFQANCSGESLALDNSGSVYVISVSWPSNAYTTVKYNGDGDEVWSSSYGPISGYSWAGSSRDIALDPAGNVYVTCDSPGADGETDYVTIKYAQDNSPSTPSNISPENGANSNSPVSNLRSSPFSDPDAGDTHACSQWQVTSSSDNYDNPVFDSGTTNSSLIQIALPSGTTDYGTTYYWHVRHQDNHGAWSPWSAETSFTVGHSPDQPSNIVPPTATTGVSLTPMLQSSAFSDPDAGDTHAASQWQMTTTAGTYSSPIFDSSTDASNLTSVTVPPSLLDYTTTYYWHVRHQDNHGAWSDWSAETSFAVGRSPNQPSNIVPPTATTGVSLTPTLQSSPFSDPDSGNLHAASQWQVREISGSYSSPIYDSGTDNTNLTIIAIPSGLLSHSTEYCWHVRYHDSTGLWSDWSAETFFTTTAKGGLPFWVWIIVGVAAVLIVGVIVYLVGKRPRLGQQTAQTTTGDSRVEQAQKESTSVPDSANTQSKSVPRKGAQWKTVAGWVLFASGVVGLLANIAFVLVWSFAPLSLVVNSAVCVLFLLAGWRLSHPTTS
jgi:heme exporter protein D